MRTILAMMSAVTFGIYAQGTAAVEEGQKKMAEMAVTTQTLQFVSAQLTGKPVKGAPYSADALNQTTQTLPDGSHIVNQTSSTVYRDSEGRERREESIGRVGPWNAEGAPVKTIFISDPVAKVNYTLHPSSHTAQKMPGMAAGYSISTNVVAGGMHAGTIQGSALSVTPAGDRVYAFSRIGSTDAGAAVASGQSPAKVENLGKQMIEGVQAEGTRTTITIPAGQIGNERDLEIVSERWYSPELQVTVLSKHTDPRMGETVYKLTNVNRTEPLHSMFEVPADYTVNDPPGAVTLRTSSAVKEEEEH